MKRARALVALAMVSCDSDALQPTRLDATIESSAKVDSATDALDAAPPLRASCRGNGTVSGVWLKDSHYCLELYASGLAAARQMAFAPNGDLFLKAGVAIYVLSDTDKDGVIAPTEISQFAVPTSTITHGVAISSGYVYASSDTTIVRYAYSVGDKVATGPEQVVVRGMPAGGHYTRTLAFDSQGRLYVNVGAAGNVDITSEEMALRSMVRRFTIPNAVPMIGLDYVTGEVWAYGLRNEVGIAIDSQDHVWSVENGRDNLYDQQFGAIANDNPAEEVNRLDAPGPRFFGYPYCWTEWSFDGGLGPGTSWADDILSGGDTYCQDKTQVQPAAFALQAHAAPLGIAVYESDSFPFRGDLVIAEHGSSYRTPAIGRMLVHAVVVDGAIKSVEPLVGQSDGDAGLQQGTWDARPVDVRVGPDGAIYFSDDLGGRVFRLGYNP
jgi:glucose/arabinose dehydrogenase